MAITVPQGLRVGNNNPIDNRTVFDTLVLAKTGLNTSRRYRGLKVFIKDEQREYWFRDGTDNEHLVPYRPGASMYPVESIAERDAIPFGLRYEGLEVNLLGSSGVVKYVLVGGVENDKWQRWANESSAIAITYETSITGDGTTREFHVSHTLGARYFDVSIFDVNGNRILTSLWFTSSTQMVVQFENAPIVGEYFLIICRK